MTVSAQFFELKHQFNADIINNLTTIDINHFTPRPHLRYKVLVSIDEFPKFILNIYAHLDPDGYINEQCFKEIKCNQETVAIIHGMHVHLFDIPTHNITSHALHDYVGHIYSIPDIYSDELTNDFLVTTFEYTFLINLKTGIKWRSTPCAVDGVLISDIQKGIIYGRGDWDPPSSEWVPFYLDLATGNEVNIPN